MNPNSREYKNLEREALGDYAPSDVQSTVSFSLAPVPDRVASDAVRRPIFIDHVYITEKVPGITDFNSRLVTDDDKRKHPNEWREFMEGGIPTSSIPGIKPSEIEMLRVRRVHTLQQAAAIEEVHDEIRNAVLMARRWLLVSSGEKPRIKLEIAA